MAILNTIFIRPIIQRLNKQSITVINLCFLYKNFRYFSDSSDSKQHKLVSVFQRYGFSLAQLPDLIQMNPFLLNSSPSEVETSIKILLSLKPSRDFLVSTVSTSPGVLEIQFLEKWAKGGLQLGQFDLSSRAMRNIVDVAKRFRLNPDHVVKYLQGLKDSGFSEGTITRVLETEPTIILSNEDAIRSKIDFFLGIGIEIEEMDRIVNRFPWIVAFAVETRLKPLLNEFADLGFSLNDLRKEIIRNPDVLGFENGEFSQCLGLLRRLKCRVSIKESILQHGEFRAGNDVKLRINCLKKHGLTYRDAFTVLSKEPRVILFGIKEVEKKIEFLVKKMKFDIECMVEVPEYLGMNFDKQIVPRFNVIDFLRSNGGLGDPLSLRNFVKLSRLKFYNLYVKPYPELEKIYGRYYNEDEVKSQRHPIGLWKLFLSQRVKP